LWATVTLPSPNVTSSCDYCDFYFRKSINVPGSVINASYKFRSDDSMEFWVNEYNISKFGLCHVSGCQPSGSCTGSADNEAVWRNITSYLSKGNNIVAVHVSGCGGQEHFDMIVNVTYNSCDV